MVNYCSASLSSRSMDRQESISRRGKDRISARNKSLPFWLLTSTLLLFGSPCLPRFGFFVEAGDDDYYNGGGRGDYYDENDDKDAAQFGDDGGNDDGNTVDDDYFHWNENMSFDGVSVMPVSCINYNNGHMIKFELFENDSGYQCRFRNIGSFVVSIAHYMRAYFNYQALLYGRDFQLPGDAGYLSCVTLQETAYADTKLYAKIGCMDRETFTSTKLQLHVYTDAQCSVPYDDGESSRHHSTKGYEINGYYFSTRVSFRPPFYSCQTCTPEAISENFNKKNGNWYDDDYISQNGKKENDDKYDDYFNDDLSSYMNVNDDVHNIDDDGNANGNNDDDGGGDGNKYDDDFYRRRLRDAEIVSRQAEAAPAKGQFFDNGAFIEERSLYDNYYDIGDWNMCQRIYKYGVWCDEECRSLDTFRVDEWSKPDIFLLVVMCAFITAMMLLVLAKRLKATQKARVYGDGDNYKPGLPPLAMFMIFALILGIILVLAKLKFVNETLVFAVVTCILLFIYMLKLTLFENRRPVLLAAPKHDMFDNPMDDRLFD